MEYLILSGIILLLIASLYFLYKQWQKLKTEYNGLKAEFTTVTEKYRPILDIDQAIIDRKHELNSLKDEAAALSVRYSAANGTYKELVERIKIYEDKEEMFSYGIYRPQYSFDTSEEYKHKIDYVREQMKAMIQSATAAICSTSWSVGGSERKGEQMTKKYIKLMLRAFNGESDALLSNVSWNNVGAIQIRIRKAWEAINKMGADHTSEITEAYLKLKVQELQLVYEYEKKRQEEKEEQRQIREQMREEEKALRELKKAEEDAEKEEKRYQKALDHAKRELEHAEGEKLTRLNEEIARLQQDLQKAHDAKERAISQAQLTKTGHVYIISNIGSFGEDVYKIGMTRRLEPMDRVKELGDASVPFEFDVHAIIYSENAPELENKLHRAFDARRINRVNYRKEYFKVALTEIEEVVRQYSNSEFHLTKLAEAREYRETMALLQQMNDTLQRERDTVKPEDQFPETIF